VTSAAHDRSFPSADEDGPIAAILADRQGKINPAVATDPSVAEDMLRQPMVFG